MDTGKAHRVILISSGIVLVVGTLNSMRQGEYPKARFLIGVGVLSVGLSALAEWEPEVAAPLSVAVLTTVMLGEGNGLLSWIGDREIDTKKDASGKGVVPRREAQVGSAAAQLGMLPVKPSQAPNGSSARDVIQRIPPQNLHGGPVPLDLLANA